MNVEASSFTIDTILLDLLGVWGRSPWKSFHYFQKDLPISNTQMEYDKKNIGNHLKIKGRGDGELSFDTDFGRERKM